MSAARSQAPAVAFDIGGTWFRAAIVTPANEIESHTKQPASSFERYPQAALADLQQMLVEYLVAEASRLGELGSTADVGISLGAAIDARTGRIVGASPLWGPTGRLDFDLLPLLLKAAPELNWNVVNDVTAAALGVASNPEYSALRRFALVTISSGLALRTLEPATERVPTSPFSGLQGEIGHLPTTFSYGGRAWSRRCDCGGLDHLSAYCSGRGMSAVLEMLAAESCGWLSGSAPHTTQFAEAVDAGVSEARDLLDAFTAPLARSLLGALAVDGDIEHLVLVGGVVDGLGNAYVDSLISQMSRYGLYGSDLTTPDHFRNLVRHVPGVHGVALRGAARAARLARGRLTLTE